MTSADWHDFGQYWVDLSGELRAMLAEVTRAWDAVDAAFPLSEPQSQGLARLYLDKMPDHVRQSQAALNNFQIEREALQDVIARDEDPDALLPREHWAALHRAWEMMVFDMDPCAANLLMCVELVDQYALREPAAHPMAAIRTLHETVQVFHETFAAEGGPTREALRAILEEYGD